MTVAGSLRLVGRELVVAERRVALTGSEAGLLACLLAAGPRVVSRAELTTALWGVTSHDTGRAVDTHIHRLRQKLSGVPGVTIATIRRRGFRLEMGAPCAPDLAGGGRPGPVGPGVPSLRPEARR